MKFSSIFSVFLAALTVGVGASPIPSDSSIQETLNNSGVGNVASQFAETQDTPVTPTPTCWQSGNVMQPVINDGSTESMNMDENEGHERWQPKGSSRARSQASEARSGIRQRKTLQKSLMGRPKHQTFLLDVSKQAQALVGALKAAQTQQQEIYQMVQEQVQAHLAEELSNWRAEQQIHEEIYLERITKLEQEVSKLRTELTEAQRTVQQPVTSSESHTWNCYRQYCRKGLGFYLAQVYGK